MNGELVQVNIDDIGVIPRQDLLSDNKIGFTVDSNDDYSIGKSLFNTESTQVLYDGNQKIIEWGFEPSGRLFIDSFTHKQVNFFFDIDVNECKIKAKGPLFLAGKIHAETALQINAEALCFAETLTCHGTVLLNIQQGVGFLAPVSAHDLKIKAALVHQSADICVSGTLNVSAQFFKQTPHVNTHAKVLLLRAIQCQIAGDFKVDESVFMIVQTLMIGLAKHASAISFSGKHHIHLAHAHVQGNTTFSIAGKEQSPHNALLIENKLSLEQRSQCCFENTKITIDTVATAGKLLLKNSALICNDLEAAGGQITFDHSQYQGLDCSMLAGLFEMKNDSEFVLHESLFMDTDTCFKMHESKGCITKASDFLGGLELSNVTLHVGYLHVIESKATLVDTILSAQHDLRFDKGVDLEHSELKAESIQLNGELRIHDVDVIARHLEIAGIDADITQLYSYSEHLSLKGSQEPEKVVLKNCVLTTKQFSSQAHVTLDTTILYGVEERPISLNLNEHLLLRGSSLVTDSPVYLHENSQLKLTELSRLRTGPLYSEGSLNAKNSDIECESIVQDNASIKLEASQLIAKEGMFSRASSVTLNEHSSVKSSIVQLSRGSLMAVNSEGVLVAIDAITTDSTSLLTSQNGMIITKKLTALGRGALVDSMLCAEELKIYSEFEAEGNNFIAAKNMELQGKISHHANDGKNTLRLNIEGELNVANGPGISSDGDVVIDAKTFNNAGPINVSNHFLARGGQFNNDGPVKANKITLGFDDWIVNTERLSAKILDMNGNFANILGRVSVQQAFTCSGLFKVNAGLESANNVTNNMLVSLNFGVNIPEFSADLRYIFSTANLASSLKTVATTVLPDYTNVINLASMLPVMKTSAQGLYARYKDFTWEKCTSMRRHEWIPLVVQLKNAAMFGYGACHSAYGSTSEVSNLASDVWELPSHSFLSEGEAAFSSLKWSTLATPFAGNYSDMSLVHLNCGVTVNGSTQESNVFDFNMGVEGSALSHTVNTLGCFINTGVSSGGEAAFLAHTSYNFGEMQGTRSLTLKTDSMVNTGDVNGEHVNVQIHHLEQNGHLDLREGQVLVDEFVGSAPASTHYSDIVTIGNSFISTGQLTEERVQFNYTKFKSDGIWTMTDSVAKIANLDLSPEAIEHFKNSTLIAPNFRDNSQLNYQGQVAIITKIYDHGGHIFANAATDSAENKNLFYLKTDGASLHGSGELDNAMFDIEHFNDGADFVAGRGIYSNYHVNSHFTFETKDAFRLDDVLNRTCDVTVIAREIAAYASLNDYGHDITFISTEGDVLLANDIVGAKNLYVQSANKILMNRKIMSLGITQFEAKGGYYNLGGALLGKIVAVKASEIKNITPGSIAATQSYALPMGNGGIIHGSAGTYLQATEKDIENDGGKISSDTYTQLLAKGNVYNVDNVGSHVAVYSVGSAIVQDFNGALIAGGAGNEASHGFGVYIQAGGKVIQSASDIVSLGSNYVEGDGGIVQGVEQQTYNVVRKHYKHHGGWVTETGSINNVRGSTVQSATNRNILVTEHGGVDAVAASFIAPGGTDIFARDDVHLNGLKTPYSVHNSSSNGWGSKHSSTLYGETETPTLFYGDGLTRIISTKGTIDAQGAYFIGAGDLMMKANKQIILGVDILSQKLIEKSRGFSLSIPGLSAVRAYEETGSLMAAAAAEDSTLAKIWSLSGSGSGAEILANSANLGVNLFNTTNSAMRGLANGTFGKEMLARYGLGGEKGFAPTITLSHTNSSKTTNYQTLGPGGINIGGNLLLEAGEKVVLKNGVQVHAGGNIEVNTPELLAQSAALNMAIHQKTITENVGINTQGDLQNIGVGYSEARQQGTHHVNAALSAGGNMWLHNQGGAMHLVELDGANLLAGTLDADIEKLVVSERQDIMESKTKSGSLSTDGQVSFYKGEGRKAVTQQQTGIHVVDGINTNGHHVHVGLAEMNGGIIDTDGKNDIVIDKVVATQVIDDEHSDGFGLRFNANDLGRLAGQQPSNAVGEQAIAIVEVNVDKVRYKAVHTPVINGKRGTDLDIKELNGPIHTQSADGRTVLRDEETHVVLDAPVTNGAYLETGASNIQAGAHAIGTQLDQLRHPEERHPADLDTNPLPFRGKEDEGSASDPDEKGVALPPEVAQAISEIIANVLDQISPELKRDLQEKMCEIQQEAKTGKVSKEKEDAFNQQLATIFSKVLQEETEEHLGDLTNTALEDYAEHVSLLLNPSLAKMSVKSVVGVQGALVMLSFNLGLSAIENQKDHMPEVKKAVADTAGECTVMLVINMGELSGPVAWGVLAAGAIDNLTYDQNNIDSLNKEGREHLHKVDALIKDEDYFSAYMEQSAGYHLKETADRLQIFHTLASYPEKVAHRLSKSFLNGWNGMTRADLSSSIPPVDPASQTRYRFFDAAPNKLPEAVQIELLTWAARFEGIN